MSTGLPEWDPERDARLNITGGPPRKSSQPPNHKRFLFLATLASILVVFLVAFLWSLRDRPVPDRAPPLSSPTTGSLAPDLPEGLSKDTLAGLADEVARAQYFGDDVKTNALALQGESLGGCDITGFGYYAKDGDLADREIRQLTRDQIEDRGWDIEFGHYKSEWIGIVQICP